MKPLISLFLLVFVAACSANKTKDGPLPTPPQRLKTSGLSFMPPAEENWWIGSRAPNSLVIGKVGRVDGETYAVEATSIPLERSSTRFDRNRMMKTLREHGLEAPRYRIRTHELSDSQVAGSPCALSYMLVEDRQPEGSMHTVGSVLIESLSLLCPHPADPATGSWLTYSHRSYPEDQDRVFKQRAGAVLETFQFEEL